MQKQQLPRAITMGHLAAEMSDKAVQASDSFRTDCGAINTQHCQAVHATASASRELSIYSLQSMDHRFLLRGMCYLFYFLVLCNKLWTTSNDIT